MELLGRSKYSISIELYLYGAGLYAYIYSNLLGYSVDNTFYNLAVLLKSTSSYKI